MKCKIKRNPETGEIAQVLASNGQQSLLYNSIVELLPDSIELDSFVNKALSKSYIKNSTKEEIALSIWNKTQTPSFKKWFGKGVVDQNQEPMLVYPYSEEGNIQDNSTAIVVNAKDEARTIFEKGSYELENKQSYYQITNEEVDAIDPTLDTKMTSFMKSVGVDVNLVKNIKDSNGKVINAYGAARLTQNVIEVTSGRKYTTLAEESAHMMTAMLGMEHPLMKVMMKDVEKFAAYSKVKQVYADTYEREEQFRFEAVGKVIADYIGQQHKDNVEREMAKTWFDKIKIIIGRMLGRVDTSIPRQAANNFELLARKMLQDRQGNNILITESTELQKLKALKELGQKVGMDSNGVMNSNIKVDYVKNQLSILGFEGIELHRMSSGKYQFTINDRIANPFQDYYDLKESPTQESIVKSIMDTNAKKLPDTVKDAQGRDRYVLVGGKMVEMRVSDAQTELFNKNKTQAEIDRWANSNDTKVAMEGGTVMHDYNEDILNYIIDTDKDNNLVVGDENKRGKSYPMRPSLLPAGPMTVEFKNSMQYLADEISAQQKLIDPKGKAVVITENFVLTADEKLGGSQDVTIIYSDGSAAIYDYKFMQLKPKKLIDGTYGIPENTRVNFFKERSFNMQLSKYKEILQKEYGVKVVRATRILPFNVQYAKTKSGDSILKVASIEGFKKSDKEYLLPLPVANEIGLDKGLNNVLTKLFKKRDSLALDLKDSFAKGGEVYDNAMIEIESVKKSIQHIQLFTDLDPLFESINQILTNEANLRDDITVDTLGDLNKMLVDIKMFSSMRNGLRAIVKTKDKETSKKLDKITSRLSNAKASLLEKKDEILFTLHDGINIPQKTINGGQRIVGYTSEIDHPVFELASDKLKTAFGNKNRSLVKFNFKLEEQTAKMESWAKANGTDLIGAYSQLINSKTGNLIGQFSKEYHQTVKDKRMNSDVKWFKDNFKISEDAKELYNKNYEAKVKSLEQRFEPGSNMYKMQMNDWLNANDVFKSDSAWINMWNLGKYLELKDPSKFQSAEYSKLLTSENRELKEYYDFYIETNRFFNTLVNENIDANFVANIKKDWIDVLGEGGNLLESLKTLRSDLKESFMVRQDSEFVGVDNSDLKIPLMHHNAFMFKDKDGDYVSQGSVKSRDLSKNMLMFADAVFQKHELSQIKDVIETLRIHIRGQEVIETDSRGRAKYNEFVKTQLEFEESTKNADLFDLQMLGIVYGKKIQNKDIVFGGKYSMNKMVSNLMKVMSVKALPLNYVSAFGNAGAGYLNTYIKGISGRFYTTKQMAKSHEMMASRERDKFLYMTEYFNIETENWIRKMGGKLSASKLSKNLTYENLFTLFQKGDSFISNTILVSMSQNYGVDPVTGAVKTLAKLPKGTKSIMEMFEVKNDTFSSGLTNQQFDDFRRKVVYVARRVKGTNTTEEMSMMQSTVWFKSVMFFKNWIGPMTSERFGSIQYTKDVGEFEYGRFRSFAKEIFSKRFLPTLGRLGLDLVSFGKIAYKANPQELEKQFNKFLKDNPNMKGRMEVEDYIEMRERTIREAIHELKLIAGLMMIIALAAGDWDDDGKKDYTETAVTRQAYKLLTRTYLELSFFSNPQSVLDLVNNPLPMLTLGAEAVNIIVNGGEETFKAIMRDVDKNNKTPLGHYSFKALPTKYLYEAFEDFTKD